MMDKHSFMIGSALGYGAGHFIPVSQKRREQYFNKHLKKRYNAQVKKRSIGEDPKKMEQMRQKYLSHAESRVRANRGSIGGMLGGAADVGLRYMAFKRMRGRAGSSGAGAGGYNPFNASTLKKSQGIVGVSSKMKTKKEVTRAYQKASMQHHPDRGGDPEKMKELNKAMDDIRQSPWFQKLAFLKVASQRSFRDGFEKVSTDDGSRGGAAAAGALSPLVAAAALGPAGAPIGGPLAGAMGAGSAADGHGLSTFFGGTLGGTAGALAGLKVGLHIGYKRGIAQQAAILGSALGGALGGGLGNYLGHGKELK